MTTPGMEEQDGAIMDWCTKAVKRLGDLRHETRALLPQVYQLAKLMDLDSSTGTVLFDGKLWTNGIIPNAPTLCLHLLKSFPAHPAVLEPDQVDSTGRQVLGEDAQARAALEPWYALLRRVAKCRGEVVNFLQELSSRITVTAMVGASHLVHQEAMGLLCDFVRLGLLTRKTGKKLILQLQAFMDYFQEESTLPQDYQNVIGLAQDYDEPIQGLQQDLKAVGPFIAQVAEAIAPPLQVWCSSKRMETGLFVQHFGPEMRDCAEDAPHEDEDKNAFEESTALELMAVPEHAEWMLLGFLVCPEALLHCSSLTLGVVKALTRSCSRLVVHGDELLGLQEAVRLWMYPAVLEAKRSAALRMRKGQRDRGEEPLRGAAPAPGSADRLGEDADGERQREYLKALEASRALSHATGDPPSKAPQGPSQSGSQGSHDGQSESQGRSQGTPGSSHSLPTPHHSQQSQPQRQPQPQAQLPQAPSTFPAWIEVMSHKAARLVLLLQARPAMVHSHVPAMLAVLANSRAALLLFSARQAACTRRKPENAEAFGLGLSPSEPMTSGTDEAMHADGECSKATANHACSLLLAHFQLQRILQKQMPEIRAHAQQRLRELSEAVVDILEGAGSLGWGVLQGPLGALGRLASKGVVDVDGAKVQGPAQGPGLGLGQLGAAQGIGSEAAQREDSQQESEESGAPPVLGNFRGHDDDDVAASDGEENGGEHDGHIRAPGAHSTLDFQERSPWAAFREEALRVSLMFSSPSGGVDVRIPGSKDGASSEVMNHAVSKAFSTFHQIVFWSRLSDDAAATMNGYSSLRSLCSFRPELSSLLRHALTDASAQPSWALGWLAVASAFPDSQGENSQEERAAQGEEEAAGEYADALLEAVAAAGEALAAEVLSRSTSGDSLELGSARGHAALDRLCQLISAAAHVGEVDLGGEVFSPAEYLDERFRGFVRRGLREALVGQDGQLVRPSVLEDTYSRMASLLAFLQQRGASSLMCALVEEVIAEASAPSLPLHSLLHGVSEEPLAGHVATQGAVEQLCRFLLGEVLLDQSAAGVVYCPTLRAFRSTAEAAPLAAEDYFSVDEMAAFARVFGFNAVNLLASYIIKLLTALVAHLDRFLKEKGPTLSRLAAAMPAVAERARLMAELGDRQEVLGVCIHIGACMHGLQVLGDACAGSMQEEAAGAPLAFGILHTFACHLRRSIPEPLAAVELRQMAARAGAAQGAPEFPGPSEELLCVLLELGCGGGDTAWAELPVLLASLLSSDLWEGCAYDPHYQDFSNNANCLARCIHALLEASERASAERIGVMRAFLAERMASRRGTTEAEGKRDRERDDKQALTPDAVRRTVVQHMRVFAHLASYLSLAESDSCSRGAWASRVIFLDHLCEASCYLPRSTLEEVLSPALVGAAHTVYAHDYGAHLRARGWHPLFPACRGVLAPSSSQVALKVLSASLQAPHMVSGLSPSHSVEDFHDDSSSTGSHQVRLNMRHLNIPHVYGDLRHSGIPVFPHELLSPSEAIPDVSHIPLHQNRRRWYVQHQGSTDRVSALLSSLQSNASSSNEGGPGPVPVPVLGQGHPHDGALQQTAFKWRGVKSQSGFLGPALRQQGRQGREHGRRALSGPLGLEDIGEAALGVQQGYRQGQDSPSRSNYHLGHQAALGEDVHESMAGMESAQGVLSAIKGWGTLARHTPQLPAPSKWTGAFSALSGRILGGSKGQHQQGPRAAGHEAGLWADVDSGRDAFLDRMFGSVLDEAAQGSRWHGDLDMGVAALLPQASNAQSSYTSAEGQVEPDEGYTSVDEEHSNSLLGPSHLGLKPLKIPKPVVSPVGNRR